MNKNIINATISLTILDNGLVYINNCGINLFHTAKDARAYLETNDESLIIECFYGENSKDELDEFLNDSCKCSDCGEWLFPNDEVYTSKDNNTLCDSCSHMCNYCENFFTKKEIHDDNICNCCHINLSKSIDVRTKKLLLPNLDKFQELEKFYKEPYFSISEDEYKKLYNSTPLFLLDDEHVCCLDIIKGGFYLIPLLSTIQKEVLDFNGISKVKEIGVYHEVATAFCRISNYYDDVDFKFLNEVSSPDNISIELLINNQMDLKLLESSLLSSLDKKDYDEAINLITTIKSLIKENYTKVIVFDSFKQTGLTFEIRDKDIREKQNEIFEKELKKIKTSDSYIPTINEIITYKDAYIQLKESIKSNFVSY